MKRSIYNISGLKKGVSLTLSLVFLVFNCALAHSAESNFWAERRQFAEDRKKSVQNSSLFAQLPNHLSATNSAQILKNLPTAALPFIF